MSKTIKLTKKKTSSQTAFNKRYIRDSNTLKSNSDVAFQVGNKHLKDSPIKNKETYKVVDFYSDLFSMSERPVSEHFIEHLAEELVSWAMNDKEAYKLTQFFHLKGIPSATFYRWTLKRPKLMEARKAAMEIIGNRREIGALKNTLNTQMVMKMQAVYDSEWWDMEVKRADLKAKTEAKVNHDTRYTILLDSYKDEDINKLKQKDNEEKVGNSESDDIGEEENV